MRTFINRICLGILTCTTVSLGAELTRPITWAELAAGYRHDNFRWTMVDIDDVDDNTWNMRFKELQMAEITGRYAYTSCINYAFRLNAGYARILDGHVRMSGFDGFVLEEDDGEDEFEELEYSRITADCKKGEVSDFEAGVGYTFTDNDSRWMFTPMFGWSLHYQYFKIQNPEQVVNTLDDPTLLGDIPNFNGYYRPRWYGPWIGMDMLIQVDVPCLLLFGSVEWHWVQFHAKGKWNFDDRFINKYTQTGHGNGIVATLGFNYKICPQWYIGIVGNYKNFHGDHKGHQRSSSLFNNLQDQDQVFGTMPALAKPAHIDLRPIKWNSWSIAASLDFRFWNE